MCHLITNHLCNLYKVIFRKVRAHNTLNYQWFPDSYHLILTAKDKLALLEYDGTNETVVYSGIFLESFSYPWPNGQKLILLTSLNSNPYAFANLYGLNLE